MNNTLLIILVLSPLFLVPGDFREIPEAQSRELGLIRTASPSIQVKRQSADVALSEYMALLDHDCYKTGCGVVDIINRLKRSSSDQRIAELQALMALVKSSDLVAHGQYDPFRIGKRKRSGQFADTQSDRQWGLLRALLEKDA